MQLQDFHQLLSTQGQAAIQTAEALAPKEEDFLRCYGVLLKHFPQALAKAALETVLLRHKAVKSQKMPHTEKLYFTREALEQASSNIISAYRARRYQGCTSILDLGCSIGSDSITLAHYAPVIGIDRDPLRLMMAHQNCSVLELEERTHFIQADLNHPLPLISKRDCGIFFDPSRRSDGKRIFSVNDYQPSLTKLHNWLAFCSGMGVKLSPAVRYHDLQPYLEQGAEVEFISLSGNLKEAVLWLNGFPTTQRRATLLPGEFTLEETNPAPPLPLSQPLAYIYEPDGAVMRAGLIAQLGWQLKAAQMDADIAYLTAPELHHTPFANVWLVEDWLPFQLKRLRAYLRERHIGQVIIKKRGSPWQPEELTAALKLRGTETRLLFLTHLQGKPIVIIAQYQP